MARSAPAISTFTSGEISPRLEGRIEIEKYRSGLSDLTNMIVQPHGGLTRRPGTEYLGAVKDSSVKTRIIPFQFKTSDTYILEFGDQYMRVFRNGLQVLTGSAKSITGATNASPVVITSNSHGYSNDLPKKGRAQAEHHNVPNPPAVLQLAVHIIKSVS